MNVNCAGRFDKRLHQAHDRYGSPESKPEPQSASVVPAIEVIWDREWRHLPAVGAVLGIRPNFKFQSFDPRIRQRETVFGCDPIH
jgi:hypothetical protein